MAKWYSLTIDHQQGELIFQNERRIMNTMNYKGFIGSVAFSEEDNVFFGKIEGIDGLVNFEGDNVSELKKSIS